MRHPNRSSTHQDSKVGTKTNLKRLIVDYDHSADVFYLFVGTPSAERPTINWDMNPWFTVRCDQESGEVVGLTVLDCREDYPEFLRFARDPKRRRPFFLALLRALNAVWQFHRQEAERTAALAAVPAQAASG